MLIIMEAALKYRFLLLRLIVKIAVTLTEINELNRIKRMM
jgi:hypothetical protein